MKRTMQTRQVGAYMTLEATSIMGWVVFILTFLIYLSFYSYNRCILFQDSYAIAFRVSQKPLSATRKLEYAHAKIDEQFGKKYVAAKQMEKSVSVSGGKVAVDARLNTKPSEALKSEFLPAGRWTLSTRVEVEIKNPTEMTRGFRKAENLLNHE